MRVASVFAVVVLLVLFGFPKAGLYAGNVPITAGYLLIGLAALAQLICIGIHQKRSLPSRYLCLATLIVVLAAVEFFCYRAYGPDSFGTMVSVLVSTILMPVVTLMAAHWLITTLGMPAVLRTMRVALMVVLAIGLASFAVYNATGHVIGIPFVTTTGSDLSLVATKHNLRGPIIKMFSTYNNGNILGINLLMWGPIAAFGVARYAAAHRSLCVLTLSRSVWVGMIALEIGGAVFDRSVRRVFIAVGAAFVMIGTVVFASIAIGKDPTEFLLDLDLGGRVTNLQEDLEVISNRRVRWGSESLYAASYLAFGPIGMALLVLTWVFPILAGGKEPIQRVARIVLTVYLLIASVEGAFTLIPTQATYWFVAAIAMAPRELISLTRGSDGDSRNVLDSSQRWNATEETAYDSSPAKMNRRGTRS